MSGVTSAASPPGPHSDLNDDRPERLRLAKRGTADQVELGRAQAEAVQHVCDEALAGGASGPKRTLTPRGEETTGGGRTDG